MYHNPEFYEIKLITISRSLLSKERIKCTSDYSIVKINKHSPKTYKNAVLALACYFRREFNYDFAQYDPRDDSDYESWVFITRLGRAFGACTFRKTKYNNTPKWKLDWVWIHPFLRRKRILSKVQKIFRNKYDDFLLELPLSDAMFKFALENHKDVLGKYYNYIHLEDNMLDDIIKTNMLELDYRYINFIIPDYSFTIISCERNRKLKVSIEKIVAIKDKLHLKLKLL